MFIELDGWKAKLRFSACHLIPDHPKCGRLHGHTYAVSVRLEGDLAGDFVMDFEILKNIVTRICDRLDHRILMAQQDSRLSIEEDSGHYNIAVLKSCKHYVLPRDDVLLLPIPSVSAEDLCRYFLSEITSAIKINGYAERLSALYVRVDEGIGQGAGCNIALNK